MDFCPCLSLCDLLHLFCVCGAEALSYREAINKPDGDPKIYGFWHPTLAARDLVPDHWIENIPATNNSIQTSLVFQTVAGVAYRVESSSDSLTDWTTESEFYGLGNEYVVPMREFTAPPPPEPGDPPAVTFVPTTNVSLLLQPSSAPEGGIVVSWKSLDDGRPMTMLVEGTLHEDWNSIPLYSQYFGDFYFFVLHLSGTAALLRKRRIWARRTAR